MKKSLLVLALLFSLAAFSQSPVDRSFPPESCLLWVLIITPSNGIPPNGNVI